MPNDVAVFGLGGNAKAIAPDGGAQPACMPGRKRAKNQHCEFEVAALHEAAKDCARIAADTARIRCKVARIDG
jgi:hypothetical protein